MWDLNKKTEGRNQIPVLSRSEVRLISRFVTIPGAPSLLRIEETMEAASEKASISPTRARVERAGVK